jgi:DNA repair protein RadD
MQLRDYQKNIIDAVYQAWAKGAKNVLVQLPTGAGKTIIFSHAIANFKEWAIAIAHRVELVSQISLALARHGVYHNIIAQKNSIKEIIALHMFDIGKSFYDPNAPRIVAGVDTLVRMSENSNSWFRKIKLVIQDEAHHVLRGNKWGKAAELFPNAVGLYPTATPCRADGRGLSRNSDGIIDVMIEGRTMRDLIRDGYLTDYRIVAPPNDLDLSNVNITDSGEFSPEKLRRAVHKSQIVGDVVNTYLKFAPLKLGVTFAVDVESATEIAARFKFAGIPAEVISSKTPDLLRATIMQRFKNREILQIVNVDLLGEGVDVPAIEVVSMARPTNSYGLFVQQFGRALRPMDGKMRALIIDHVGNIKRHGLPDKKRIWTLERFERRAKSNVNNIIQIKICLNPECMSAYESIYKKCPYCGFYKPPARRSTPEEVDGDLTELDENTLLLLRGEIKKIDDIPRVNPYQDPIIQRSIINKHRARQKAQQVLRG